MSSNILEMPIDRFFYEYGDNHRLSARVAHYTSTNDVKVVRELAQISGKQLKEWRNIGKRTIDYIDETLSKVGIELGSRINSSVILPQQRAIFINLTRKLIMEISLLGDYDSDVTPHLQKAAECLEIASAYMKAKTI